MIILPDYADVIKSIKMALNSKHRKTKKLKSKDIETQKTKTQKNENLVLSKQQIENADLYNKPVLNKIMTIVFVLMDLNAEIFLALGRVKMQNGIKRVKQVSRQLVQ